MAPTLNAIGIVVADMGRSLAFYRRLGLDIPATADTEPHVEATLPGGLRLLFDSADTVRSFDPEWTPAQGGPGTGLAFACDSPAEVDQVYAELVQAGYEGHKEPWDAPWGQRYAMLHDPDGNGVDLFAARP
jgi:catechol 2,3-dioxygenase-like lactoylglutathione lyase family enzyme